MQREQDQDHCDQQRPLEGEARISAIQQNVFEFHGGWVDLRKRAEDSLDLRIGSDRVTP